MTDDDIFDSAREGYEVLGIVPDAEHWYRRGRPAHACLAGCACFVLGMGRCDSEHGLDSLGRSEAWFDGVSDGFAGVPVLNRLGKNADYWAGRVLGERGRERWVPRKLDPMTSRALDVSI